MKTKKKAKQIRKPVKKETLPDKIKKAKPVKKTPIKVTIVRKITGKAPEKQEFYLKDGRQLKDIYELIDELETMAEETFRHHANEIDNHFANWIEHTFGEKSLAEEIRYINDRLDTQRAIMKHLIREMIKKK